MDDFCHHLWMDNDMVDIKFVVLCNNYTDWIIFKVVWKTVSGIEVETLATELLEYENTWGLQQKKI